LSKNGLNTSIAILESPYLEIIDQAIAALKAEIERCGRDFNSFDHQRPFSELVDCGFTEQDASVALDRAEEILGFWHWPAALTNPERFVSVAGSSDSNVL